jgi:hypothetical protein
VTFRKVTVGTAVVPLAVYNAKRVGIIVLNNGSTNVYIHHNPTLVKEEGLVLTPLGTITFLKAWGDPTEYALYAVADAEGQDVRVYESFG